MKQIIIISLAVITILSLLLSGCQGTGRAGGSQNIFSNGATSCDGDSICEVAKTVSTPRGSTGALILTSDAKSVIVDGSLNVVDGSLSAKSLTGTGNAYVCTDNYGNLFRSTTPCLQTAISASGTCKIFDVRESGNNNQRGLTGTAACSNQGLNCKNTFKLYKESFLDNSNKVQAVDTQFLWLDRCGDTIGVPNTRTNLPINSYTDYAEPYAGPHNLLEENVAVLCCSS